MSRPPAGSAARAALALALGGLVASGCATARSRPPEIAFREPEVVVGRAAGEDEARFAEAERLSSEGRRAEARQVLEAILARPELTAAVRARALAERAALELDEGQPERAQATLDDAMAALDAGGVPAARDPVRAKALFLTGEIARARLLEVRLDPAADPDLLARELERVSQLLLSAQGRYLEAMRVGVPEWVVAAGARVGELYDGLYGQLVGLPPPPGLDAEGVRAYRAELRESVRVLASKAVEAYEATLEAARSAGVDTDFVRRTEERLQRMRRVQAGGEEPTARESGRGGAHGGGRWSRSEAPPPRHDMASGD